MKKNRKAMLIGWGMMLILLVSLACRLPLAPPDSQPLEGLEATLTVLQTTVADQEQQLLDQDTQPHGLEEPQPTATVVVENPPLADAGGGNSAYRGFVAVTDGQFQGYDFEGQPLDMSFPAPQNYFNENEVSVLPETIYYTDYGGEATGVYRASTDGTQRLEYITSGNSGISIAVSADEQKIAWSSGEWVDQAPTTRIDIANLDGSGQVMAAEMNEADQEEFWRVYHPVRWTEDDTLIYATGLTGIGGYMLFWGYNGMYEFDPANGETRTLVSDAERLGLCLSSISHNRAMVAIVCGNGEVAVRVRQLADGGETVFPVLEEQNLAGSAKFSSDDRWLAYVTQTQNMDDERGKVVVMPVDGSQAPRVVAKLNGGSFLVNGWLDEDRFLVTRFEFQSNHSTIWLMNRDGSLAQELVVGNFVGLLP